jgi:hypothetical protein
MTTMKKNKRGVEEEKGEASPSHLIDARIEELGDWRTGIFGATMGSMRTIDLLAELKPKIADIARRYGASDLRVFGSAARGEDVAGSDIDLVVSLERGRTLLDLVGLEQDLTALLGRKVDVVVEGGISPYLESRILSEAIAI